MPKRVTPPEAAKLLEQGWRYIDVRSAPEFSAGHPTGAANVPIMHVQGGRMTPNPDFQRVMEAAFPRDEKLVIGCKTGSRSRQAAALLEAAGYTNVVDVRGGLAGERDALGRVTCAGWQDSGLPVSTTPAPGASYDDLTKKR